MVKKASRSLAAATALVFAATAFSAAPANAKYPSSYKDGSAAAEIGCALANSIAGDCSCALTVEEAYSCDQ